MEIENILEWIKQLQWENPQKYSELKMWATAYRLFTNEDEAKKEVGKHTSLNEELYKMIDYLNYLDDESNRLYKACCERGGGYFAY